LCLTLGAIFSLSFPIYHIVFLIESYDMTGFSIVKDNGTIQENPVSAENGKVPSLWDDGDMSPVASSNGHIKEERRYSGGDQVAESEIAYDFGDESVRSPGSAGRSASGSPFKSSGFGMHDSSPSKRESYRYLFQTWVYYVHPN
jgi:epidermal growth factor receptor substrate 15